MFSETCSGNSQSAVHVSVSRNGAIDAVLTGFEIDCAFIEITPLIDDQFEIADYFVVLKYNQNMLHAVIVGQKDFDVTSRSGVLIGVPADRRNGLDDEIGVSRGGVIRGA